MIQLVDICAGYDHTKVLHNVSFKLEQGSNLSIIGPNGCGKTTLLRVMSGLLDYSGQVLIDKIEIKGLKRKELAKKIGLLSQHAQFYFNYTVVETVMMGRFAHLSSVFLAGPSEQDRQVVEQALKIVDLTSLQHRSVDTLSGGQRQRVFLAKLIAQDPDIILLDEPTNHLDLSHQVELILFLKKWSKQHGKIIVGVLHDLNLSMLLSDHILLLQDGYVRALDHYRKICGSPLLSAVYKMDVAQYMLSGLKRWDEIDRWRQNSKTN